MRVAKSRMKIIGVVSVMILFTGALTSLFNLWPSPFAVYEAWFRSLTLFGLALFIVIFSFLQMRRFPNASPIGRLFYLLGAILLGASFVILGVYSLLFYVYNISPPIEITSIQIGLFFLGMITTTSGRLLLPVVNGAIDQQRTKQGWGRTILAAVISSFILIGLLFLWVSFF